MAALPAHYKSDLLAKCFAGQTEPWTEYVDAAKVSASLSKVVDAGTKNDPAASPHTTTSSAQHQQQHRVSASPTGSAVFFFRASREEATELRQQQNAAAVKACRFSCALKEKFGSSINCLLGDPSKPNQSASSSSSSSANVRVSKEQIQLVVGICDNLLRAIL